jgi:hypothetical protein
MQKIDLAFTERPFLASPFDLKKTHHQIILLLIDSAKELTPPEE